MMNTNKSKLALAILMISALLSFAIFEGLKKVGRLPEFREDERFYAITAGVVLIGVIGVVRMLVSSSKSAG